MSQPELNNYHPDSPEWRAAEDVVASFEKRFSGPAVAQDGGTPRVGMLGRVELYWLTCRIADAIAKVAAESGTQSPHQKFIDHLNRASEEVRKWPEWKQNCLGGVPDKKQPAPRQLRLGLDFGNVIKKVGSPELVEGALDGIRTLAETFGRQIYIVSRVDDPEAERRARLFLTDHKILGPLVPSFYLFFCRRRHEKASIAKAMGITHFVDDRPEVLSHMHSVPHRFALNPTPEDVREWSTAGNWLLVKSWADLLGTMKRKHYLET